MAQLTFADVLETAAKVRGDAPAISHQGKTRSWADLNRRATNLGAHFLEKGLSPQGKVAIYTYNHMAYNETVFAIAKAGGTHVNVNYRYMEEELQYLLENADTEFVIVHEDFIDRLAKVLGGLPKIKEVLVLNDSGSATHERISGALDYDTLVEIPAPANVQWPERSPDHLMFLYTGGTTGMPKGVMWRQGDLLDKLGGGLAGAGPSSLEELENSLSSGFAPRMLVGVPLMHGTGWFTSLTCLFGGGTTIFLDDTKHFKPADFWTVVEREKPFGASIVGDTFARPLLRELRESEKKYDLSSLIMMVSSGVMWSEETKKGLIEFMPSLMIADAFSSSEALGMGTSITTAAGTMKTGKFMVTPHTRLFDESLEPIETAPGAQGMVGAGGGQPVGYYKDPEKSAKTFVNVDGEIFSIPGDWAEVAEDGVTLNLLGRGSVCINTGGEKVFVEEVEEVIKTYDNVKDVVVVGIDDERWGQAITAVVSTLSGPPAENMETNLITHVKNHLAGYKAPKHVVFVDSVYRSPSGKADYKATKQTVIDALSSS